MRYSIEQIVEFKKLAATVLSEVDKDIFNKGHIEDLCREVLNFCRGFDAVPREPKAVLYEAICRLHPSSFGRGDLAKHFAELLAERYNPDGSKKETK